MKEFRWHRSSAHRLLNIHNATKSIVPTKACRKRCPSVVIIPLESKYKGRPAVWIKWGSSTLICLILRWNLLHLRIKNPSHKIWIVVQSGAVPMLCSSRSVYASIVDLGLHEIWLVHGQDRIILLTFHHSMLRSASLLIVTVGIWKRDLKSDSWVTWRCFQRRDRNGDGISSRVVKEDTECNRQSFPAPSSCSNQTVLSSDIRKDDLKLHRSRNHGRASNCPANHHSSIAKSPFFHLKGFERQTILRNYQCIESWKTIEIIHGKRYYKEGNENSLCQNLPFYLGSFSKEGTFNKEFTHMIGPVTG
jgi:hypothetical protein